MSAFFIRNSIQEDLPAIVAIYNQAVAAGFQTADTEPWRVEDKLEWHQQHQQAAYPLFVAIKNDEVVGFVTISAYRPGRGALRFAKEISYYVDYNNIREGIGEALVKHAVNQAPVYVAKTLIAIVLDANTPSISLLKKLGFESWGHLPNVAEFSGVTCGHCYLGLHV
jgi:L-amino acid N-acyltransferase YncA